MKNNYRRQLSLLFITSIFALTGIVSANASTDCEQGEFYAPHRFGVGEQLTGAAVADFNGDGNVDIVTANSGNSTLSVLYGNGSGDLWVLTMRERNN